MQKWQFKNYLEYVEEHGLNERIKEDFRNLNLEYVRPEMITEASLSYIRSVFTINLQRIAHRNEGKEEIIHINENDNYEITVLFHWMMVAEKKIVEMVISKKINEIQKKKNKTEEEEQLLEQLKKQKEDFENQMMKLVTYIEPFAKDDSEIIENEQIISIYREIIKLSNWREESKVVRLSKEQVEAYQPKTILFKEKFDIKKLNPFNNTEEDNQIRFEGLPEGLHKDEVNILNEYILIMNTVMKDMLLRYYQEEEDE